jgi:hypothetical protein
MNLTFIHHIIILGETKNACRILVEKPLEKLTFGKQEEVGGNIKMGFRKTGYKSGRCMELLQDSVQCSALVLNLRVLLPQT